MWAGLTKYQEIPKNETITTSIPSPSYIQSSTKLSRIWFYSTSSLLYHTQNCKTHITNPNRCWNYLYHSTCEQCYTSITAYTYMYIYKEFRRLFHLLVNISFEFSYEYVEITIMLTLIYKSERLDLLFWLHFSVCAECSWTLLLWFRINFPFNRTRYHHIIVTPSPK